MSKLLSPSSKLEWTLPTASTHSRSPRKLSWQERLTPNTCVVIIRCRRPRRYRCVVAGQRSSTFCTLFSLLLIDHSPAYFIIIISIYISILSIYVIFILVLLFPPYILLVHYFHVYVWTHVLHAYVVVQWARAKEHRYWVGWTRQNATGLCTKIPCFVVWTITGGGWYRFLVSGQKGLTSPLLIHCTICAGSFAWFSNSQAETTGLNTNRLLWAIVWAVGVTVRCWLHKVSTTSGYSSHWYLNWSIVLLHLCKAERNIFFQERIFCGQYMYRSSAKSE